jgi:hypothetical protein
VAADCIRHAHPIFTINTTMFYEAISHTSVPVDSAADAARRIRSREARSFDALIWKNSQGQRIAAVADGGLNSPWGEVAVINLDTNRQLDSITFAWIDTEAEAISHLEKCQDSAPLGDSPANLPLDGEGDQRPADFECGCCGTNFTSTIADQRIHDQDEGFGYCPSCLKDFITA